MVDADRFHLMATRKEALLGPMTAYGEGPSRAPRTLTEREQAALLQVTSASRKALRDHVLYAMALGTGLRAHELLALDVGDVFDASGEVRRRVRLRVFKGHGRGPNDEQEVLLAESLRTKLTALRRWKSRRGESLDAGAPIFVSARGTRLSLRQLRNAFAVWQERAGFERRVSFHMCRHAACSSIYALSKDLRLTQRFARHRSVLTTMIYTHPSDEDLVRAVERIAR